MGAFDSRRSCRGHRSRRRDDPGRPRQGAKRLQAGAGERGAAVRLSDTVIRYATVDKPERKIVRFLYVNPEAFAAAKKGTPAPDGTVLIMEDHAARLGPDGTPLVDLSGRFIPAPTITGLFLQKKRPGWGAGYAEEKRNGTWEYARFNPDGTRHPGSVDNCFGCHKPRGVQDFTFTFSDYVQARK